MKRPALSPLALMVVLSALCAFAVFFLPALACTTSSGGDGDDSSASSGQADDDTGDDDDECAACVTTGECTEALGEGWICEGGCCEDTGGGDDDDDDAGDDDAGDDDTTGPTTLSGIVVDYWTKDPIEEALVEVLNDSTGDPFVPSIEEVSGENGEVEFDIPAGNAKVAIRVSRPGAVHTVQFHMESGRSDATFLLVEDATLELLALSVGVSVLDGKAIVLGGIFYGDADDKDAIGCAEANLFPDDGRSVFYFGPDALPTTSRSVTGGSPSNGQGTNPDYSASNEPLSLFVSLNNDVEENLVLEGRVYEDEGDGTLDDSVAVSADLPRLFMDTISIVDAYFSRSNFSKNPTRAWCTQ
ncbi:hypothetical protein K8I61_17180 [bacterium]|nr:hypothetical protein [bacterium]